MTEKVSKVNQDDNLRIEAGFTDTIQEKNSYQKCTNSVNTTERYENGTPYNTTECTETETKYRPGESVYVFDFDNIKVNQVENNTVDVSFVAKPNDITKIIHKESRPALSTEEAIRQLNKEYYYNGGEFNSTNYQEIKSDAQNLPVKVEGGKLGALADVNGKSLMSNSGRYDFKLHLDDRSATVELGSHTGLFGVTQTADYTEFDKYKDLNTPSTGGSVEKAQPVSLTCGDDSTTGFGNIQIDCSSVSSQQDIAFYTPNGDLLPYEWESFNPQQSGDTVAWVYNDWSLDGTANLRVAYGSGPADQSDTVETWNNPGQNIQAVYHMDETSGSLIDSGPNNIDSDSTTGTTYNIDGEFNGGRGFNGNGDRINTPDWGIENTDTFTVLYYSKPSSIPGSSANSQITIGGPEGNDVMFLGYRDNGYTFNVNSGSTNIRGPGNPTTGVFQQIAGVYDDPSGQAYLYANGNSVQSTNTDGSLNPTVEDGAITSNIESDIDEVKIYADAKSSTFIQADYDASPTGGQIFFEQQTGQSTGPTENPPSFTLTNPNDDATFTAPYEGTKDVTFDYGISAGFDGTITLDIAGASNEADSFSASQSKSFSYTKTLSPGSYSWQLVATSDATGNTYTSNLRSFTVNEETPTEPSVSLSNPSDGASFSYGPTESSVDVTFDWGVTAGDESGDSRLYVNNNQEATRTFSSLQSRSYSETLSLNEGTYDFYAEADTDAYTKQTGTRTITVNQENATPPDVDIQNPGNGEIFTYEEGTGGANVSLDWSITSFEETGDSYAYIDNNQVAARSFGSNQQTSYTTTETLTAGNYTFKAEASTSSSTETTSVDFEVREQAEPAPTFTLSQPVDQENFTYIEGSGGVNITFDYSVQAPAAGTLTLKVEKSDGGTQFIDTSIPSAGSYSYTDVLERFDDTSNQGAKIWRVEFTSDNTGNIYDSNTKEFYVTEVDEIPPTVNITSPKGTTSLYPLGWSFVYDFNVEWLGADDLNISANVTYPGGFEQKTNISGIVPAMQSSNNQIFNGNFQVTNQSNRSTGQYIFKVIGDSQATGNTYTETQQFTVEDQPLFQLGKPVDNNTVTVQEGENINFNYGIGSFYGGNFQLQVKQQSQGNTEWTSIYNGTHPGGNQELTQTTSYTDGNLITFQDQTGYEWRIQFTDTEQKIYNSESNNFIVTKTTFAQKIVDFIATPFANAWEYIQQGFGDAGKYALGLLFMLVVVGLLAYVKVEAGVLGVPLMMIVNVLLGLWPGWLVLAVILAASGVLAWFAGVFDG